MLQQFTVQHASAQSFLVELFSVGSTNRAGRRAGTAIDASIGIDLIMIGTLRDRVYGAFGFTSAAADAFVIDNICHGEIPPYRFSTLIVTCIPEKASGFPLAIQRNSTPCVSFRSLARVYSALHPLRSAVRCLRGRAYAHHGAGAF